MPTIDAAKAMRAGMFQPPIIIAKEMQKEDVKITAKSITKKGIRFFDFSPFFIPYPPK